MPDCQICRPGYTSIIVINTAADKWIAFHIAGLQVQFTMAWLSSWMTEQKKLINENSFVTCHPTWRQWHQLQTKSEGKITENVGHILADTP